jgi:hypothetical protein
LHSTGQGYPTKKNKEKTHNTNREAKKIRLYDTTISLIVAQWIEYIRMTNSGDNKQNRFRLTPAVPKILLVKIFIDFLDWVT